MDRAVDQSAAGPAQILSKAAEQQPVAESRPKQAHIRADFFNIAQTEKVKREGVRVSDGELPVEAHWNIGRSTQAVKGNQNPTP